MSGAVVGGLMALWHVPSFFAAQLPRSDLFLLLSVNRVVWGVVSAWVDVRSGGNQVAAGVLPHTPCSPARTRSASPTSTGSPAPACSSPGRDHRAATTRAVRRRSADARPGGVENACSPRRESAQVARSETPTSVLAVGLVRTTRDFAELVVPELRQHGRLQKVGEPGRRCGSGPSAAARGSRAVTTPGAIGVERS